MLAPPNLSLFLIMACFWLVFLLVSSQLVKPLGAVLDERERRVKSSQEGFDAAQYALREALARCEKELIETGAGAQRQRLAERAAGEASRRAQLDAARGIAHERLAALQRELDDASMVARKTLRESAGLLAHELASQLVGRRVS